MNLFLKSLYPKCKNILFFALFFVCFFSLSLHQSSAQETDDEEVFVQEGTFTAEENETDGDPIELFNKGQDAHFKGDLKTALDLYEQALKIMPEFPEAEFQRGQIFLDQNKITDAEQAFRKAIEYRRDWTLPMAELGSILVNRGDYIEAEQILDKAIGLNSMTFPAYTALTELKIKTKASEAELKELLQKLLYLTTKSKIPASIWAARGAVERILGETDKAKISITRALQIDAENRNALTEQIELELIAKDFKSAVTNSQKLVAKFPNSLTPKILLARSFYADGKSTEALNILSGVENPTPEIISLQKTIESNGNESIESLEKMLVQDGKNVAVLGRLCVLSRAADPAKALEYCKLASELDPSNINHAIGFGAALVQQQRYPEAIGLFKKLLSFSPENYTIRANLATALFQTKNFEEAKAEYRWITQKQPELAIGYYFLAITHDRTEEYMDAMANYQQFIKLANAEEFKLELEKVNLRLPILQNLIKKGKGKRR